MNAHAVACASTARDRQRERERQSRDNKGERAARAETRGIERKKAIVNTCTCICSALVTMCSSTMNQCTGGPSAKEPGSCWSPACTARVSKRAPVRASSGADSWGVDRLSLTVTPWTMLNTCAPQGLCTSGKASMLKSLKRGSDKYKRVHMHAFAHAYAYTIFVCPTTYACTRNSASKSGISPPYTCTSPPVYVYKYTQMHVGVFMRRHTST